MTQWLKSGLDISVECEWLLHEVTAVADWQFSGTPPCRTLLKTSSHHKQSTDHKAQWAYHQQRNAYMPQRAIWCPPLNTGGGGPNTVERRCSLYCAAISHISLCPWLPRSISIPPPVLTTVECHLRASPAALSTPRWRGVTVKDSHCHS